MARTSSWNFPNLIDPTRNCINVAEDDASIVNRTRLLMLTDPTELYHNPEFGVGLRKYLFQYNNANTIARIQDNIKVKLDQYEPCVVASETQFADGLLFSEDTLQDHPNHVKMTIGLRTTYSDQITVDVTSDNT